MEQSPCWVHAQVSERLVCEIASGFWQECEEVGEMSLKSSMFLQRLDRASRTKHEFRSRSAFVASGLSANVPVTMLDISMKKSLPSIKATDMFRAMALHDKISSCLLGGGGLETLSTFWSRYRVHFPDHPLFRDHGHHLQFCLPLLMHADEGRYLKREQLLIMSWQSMIGEGTRPQRDYRSEADCRETQGLNFKGSSYRTRFLLATLLSLHYRKKNRDGDRLKNLLNAVVDDFLEFYRAGVEVVFQGTRIKFYGILLNLKGDWPMLSKLGNLKQHFGRKTKGGAPTEQSAICHLCRAGCAGYPYHEFEINAKWYETYLQRRPWSTPSPFMRLPMPAAPELFFCFDMFHVTHKGVLAELTASALES